MPTSARNAATGWIVVCAAVIATVGGAAETAPQRLDPLAQAVVESLAFPPRTKPPELLDAAIRAADVEAYAVAGRYVTRLVDLLEKAGDRRNEVLADLGESTDPAALRRLERTLGDTVADVRPVTQAIRDAARQRRRDPARLARAAGELSSASAATRGTAFDQLTKAGIDALPVLVDLLQTDDPARQPARALARRLVRDLGREAHGPLLAWLGSDDVDHWPGVIEALAAVAGDDEPVEFAEFLLAPATVPDVPTAARQRAIRLLQRLAQGGRLPDRLAAGPLPPAVGLAAALVARRLDCTLTSDGLPAPDHLLMEPIDDPAAAPRSAGATVERFVWNPQARRLERLDLPPRAARAQEAIHLARDLAALGDTDPASVGLVLLARLEAMLVAGGDAPADPPPTDRVVEAITGPDGFDAEVAADVLDLAASRGFFPAAAAAARALSTLAGKPAAAADPADSPVAAADTPDPLPPSARRALLRALEVPDAAVQFEAARTLAVAGGDPPYRGSSRVFEILLRAATGTGEEIAVVAHHDAVARETLATGLSRFGYRPEKVATGREAILAARANADTVLVVLGARTILPSALETTQLIQRQPFGDVPPVLVTVDPLDDDGRGKFVTRLILSFSELDCVGITDRLDSLFLPQVDPTTGAVVGPPRLPDRLAQVAGPDAVAPAARAARAVARRTRAAEALALLADLGRRGWDIAAAETTARLAFMQPPRGDDATDLFSPAAAVLATIGTASAQQTLLRATERSDLPEDARKRALAGFTTSVERHGVLLECSSLRGLQARYNRASPPADQGLADAVLDIIQRPSRKARPVSADAAPPRPIR